ncbi:MAG: hypothetical protein ACD_45C00114G0001 [uncultured bacterium]|nr:MAG: hypothetical protein ACD_45C00114G0001 [uncultured bacterium]
MLVEDNHIAQQTISALLSSFQCKPILAETGEAALKLFKPGRYDLIIIDIGLPNMQGDMVAKKIREKENNSVFKVPIIALTAHATTAERKQHAACGIKKTYSKPLLRHQIATLIQNIIKKQKSV